MAVPSTPTWTATISAAMIAAGQYNVSFAQVAAMAVAGAQDVKTELWSASRNDIFLESGVTFIATTGSSVLVPPNDFDNEKSLMVYDGSVRDRAQGGSLTSITLSANDNSSDGSYVGKFVFQLTGPGSPGFDQITNYVNATKVASLTGVWDWPASPTAATDYLIVSTAQEMMVVNDSFPVGVSQKPTRYQVTNNNFIAVFPPPDRVYPIVMRYSPNLTMLDETTSTFLIWLKQRMALIKQGIKVQTMFLYNDDRYETELARWEQMKAQYGSQNPIYGQIQRHR